MGIGVEINEQTKGHACHYSVLKQLSFRLLSKTRHMAIVLPIVWCDCKI
jgi:hypothetical protein